MKKIIMGTIFIASMLIVLSACGNSNQDKMQGNWKPKNIQAKDYVGKKMEINKQNVKTVGTTEKGENVVYFNFKDKDSENPKRVRLYTSKPKDKDFDKSNPNLEGDLSFENNGKLMIIDCDGIKFKFNKA